MSVRVPPVVLFSGAAVVQHVLGGEARPTSRSVASSIPFAAASVWLIGFSLREFRLHRTTVDPIDVTSVRTLVTEGPNRSTRNPMYVGMLAALVSHAVARRSWSALLPAAAFLWLIDRCQVPAEEAALRAEFGAQFDHYAAQVPRWPDHRSVTLLLPVR